MTPRLVKTPTRMTVGVEAFRTALGRIAHFASRSSPIASLSHVLLEVVHGEDGTGHALRATTSDIDTSARVTVPLRTCDAPVDALPSLCVPADLLMGLLARTNRSEATLEVVAEQMTLRAGGEYKLNGLAGDEFPVWPTFKPAATWTVEHSALADALEFVAWCCSTDKARPTLHGVCIDAQHGRLVATDGHKLGMVRGLAGQNPDGPVAPLPQRSAQRVARALEDGPVQIEVGDGRMRFTSGACTIVSSLVNAQYPAVDQVIPKDDTLTFEAWLDRAWFLGVVERAELYTGQDLAARLELAWKDGSLTITAGASERGVLEERLPEADATGELHIWMNPPKLAGALKRLTGSRVRFRGTAPERAVILDTVDDAGRFFLIMPMRVVD